MLIDGFELTNTGEMEGAVVSNGDSFPLLPIRGQLFYLTGALTSGNDGGLYCWDGFTWVAGDISKITGTSGVKINGSSSGVASSGEVTIGIDFAIVASQDDLTTHESLNIHLTPTERTWLSAITVSYNEVNYLTGVTSLIQDQLDSKMSVNDNLAVRQLLGLEDQYIGTSIRTPELGILPYDSVSSTLGSAVEQFKEVHSIDFLRAGVRIPNFYIDTVAPIAGGVDGDVWFVV